MTEKKCVFCDAVIYFDMASLTFKEKTVCVQCSGEIILQVAQLVQGVSGHC